MSRDLCSSAKKGFICPDDLCHGADVTLCGFDKEFYEQCTRDDGDFEIEELEPKVVPGSDAGFLD